MDGEIAVEPRLAEILHDDDFGKLDGAFERPALEPAAHGYAWRRIGPSAGRRPPVALDARGDLKSVRPGNAERRQAGGD